MAQAKTEYGLYIEMYELLLQLGEMLTGDLHIIDTSDDELNVSYRVYLKDGYCFDLSRVYCCEPDEVDTMENVAFDGYCYEYFSEWPEFNTLSLKDAISLIRKYVKR